jgi:hypothetical protein
MTKLPDITETHVISLKNIKVKQQLLDEHLKVSDDGATNCKTGFLDFIHHLLYRQVILLAK